jgi:hypothetical protein
MYHPLERHGVASSVLAWDYTGFQRVTWQPFDRQHQAQALPLFFRKVSLWAVSLRKLSPLKVSL